MEKEFGGNICSIPWRKEQIPAQSSPQEKTTHKGKPRRDAEYEQQVLDFLKHVSGNGQAVSISDLVVYLCKLKDVEVIVSKADHKRMSRMVHAWGYVRRRATHTAQNYKEDPEVIEGFINRIHTKMGDDNLNPDNIVNMDETNFHFDSPCKETLAIKGSKTISIKTSGSNARCTVILAVTMSGEKLKPFVIFKGKPGAIVEKELSEMDYPEDVFFVVQEKAWNDQHVMAKWIDMVWKPFAERNDQKKLLIMDTVSTHEVLNCTEKITDTNTSIEWIPGGYTWKLQPLDVGINFPFKNKMKKKYKEFMQAQMGLEPEEQKKVHRTDVGDWVSSVWSDPEGIKAETIQKTWAKIGVKVQE